MKERCDTPVFILLLAIVGPWISPYAYQATNFDAILQATGARRHALVRYR